jgi:hypothetical protein|tara:strand:+ start:1574 stop:1801 length:228 start_codon:yes stop_codon:yes gene_type:complete
MSLRVYLIASGCIFALVALGHLVRVISQWEAQVGDWSVPMWISWIGTVVPAAFSVTALRLAKRKPTWRWHNSNRH